MDQLKLYQDFRLTIIKTDNHECEQAKRWEQKKYLPVSQGEPALEKAETDASAFTLKIQKDLGLSKF